MAPDAPTPRRLSELFKRGSFQQLVLGYVVGAWALLEIVVTGSELAGLPLTLPRWLFVILLLGLVLVVAATAVLRGARALQQTSSVKAAHRRETLFIVAAVTALLPLSFLVRNGTVRWIMWRDSPIWAAACLALAILLGIVWKLSKPIPSGEDE